MTQFLGTPSNHAPSWSPLPPPHTLLLLDKGHRKNLCATQRRLQRLDPLPKQPQIGALLYLFIIVSDVLQQKILKVHCLPDSHLRYLVYPDQPPSILQYADDTLIIVHDSPHAASQLKVILDDFTAATAY